MCPSFCCVRCAPNAISERTILKTHLQAQLIFLALNPSNRNERPLGRPRRRWEDNIRMDLEEVRGIGLIQLRIRIIGEPL